MTRFFLHEILVFPHPYVGARRYRASLNTGETIVDSASYREREVTWTREGRRAPWKAALLGALPFLLFGLAYLLEGIAALGGHFGPAFNLLDGTFPNKPLNLPAIILTAPMGVYFLTALGLLLGVIKGFPRWSYAYLGMSIFFGLYYSNGRYYGVVYDAWAWLPFFTAIILGLLLTRSLRPLARLLQGAWSDWTRISFALYAFAVPVFTVIFFDDDWGVIQLYGLAFDTVLLASAAVAFLRSRSNWGRVLSLEAAVVILVTKGILGGWFGGLRRAPGWPVILLITIYVGFLLLPALIGLLKRGVEALSSR